MIVQSLLTFSPASLIPCRKNGGPYNLVLLIQHWRHNRAPALKLLHMLAG